MNVLYVSDSPTVSGAETVLLQYLGRFRPPRHVTHVFLRDTNTRLRDALRSRGIAFTTSGSFSRRWIRSTANPVALRHFAVAFRRVWRELDRVVRDRRIELLHSFSYPSSLYTAFAARSTGRAHIWHQHDIKRVHLLNRPIYRFAASTCAWVVGPSDAVTTSLVPAGIERGRLRTVYNGVDLDRFTPDERRASTVRRELGVGPDDLGIALCGQMLPSKGHAILIEATRRLIPRWPRLHLFLVGALENRPFQAHLRRLLTGGLTDRVHFTGWRDDIPHVIRAMDIIVVPSLTEEPAALALMEAMAMGRPVVGTRTGGTPEIVLDGATGLLVPPGDAAALSETLDRLLGDAALRDRLGVAGRRRVEDRFGLERHLATIESLYDSARAGPASRTAPLEAC